MAPLPSARVTPGNAAFSHVGDDYMVAEQQNVMHAFLRV